MAQTLGSVAVGSIVKLNENGSPVNYIVVQQGLPSSMYDASCDGTWVLRQEIWQNGIWNSSGVNTLAGSTIMTTMASFLSRLDASIQAVVKTVKIPYCVGNGSSTVNSGANGLECKAFPLSLRELGIKSSLSGYEYTPDDGAKLEYFLDGISSSANSKRIAKLNGSNAIWGTRSPNTENTEDVGYVRTNGGCSNNTRAASSFGGRPALVLPSTLFVTDDGLVSVTAPPPNALTVPLQAMQGNQISVSWSAVDGADGYILERNADNGSWTQVYSGANTSFSETAGTWTTVQYRVKAGVDGTYGDYTTSEAIPVVSASTVVISGSDGDLGTLLNDVAFTVSSDGTNPLTVVETINGTETRTYTATNGATNKIPVVDLPTGYGTITITATTQATGGAVTVTREWTYTKAAITFPDAGSVAQLTQQGKTIWAKTLAEAVRVPGLWGGNLGLALSKLAGAVLYNRTSQPKYAEVNVSLANVSVGQEVNLPYNGQMVPHIVVHIGNPNPSLYDASCDGVWLLRKDIVENGTWDSDETRQLQGSTIMQTMAGYVSKYDNAVQSAMKTVKIPYLQFNPPTVISGANGIECKVFPLSPVEIGFTSNNDDYVPNDGAKLDYFDAGNSAAANKKRIGLLNQIASDWWLRTIRYGSADAYLTQEDGDLLWWYLDSEYGYRPAFIMPTTFSATYYVGTDNTIHDTQEYTEAGGFEDVNGNSVQIPNVEIGSYVGTGTSGEDNPTKIMVGFVPKFALVAYVDPSSNVYRLIIGLSGMNQSVVFNKTASDLSGGKLATTWGENSVSFTTTSAANQMNGAGNTYNYIILGFGGESA